jgi:uncharacterized cupin superfamily protein
VRLPPTVPRGYKLAAHLRAKISWHEHLRRILMSTSIVRLDGATAAEESEPPADRLIAGTPELQVSNYFTDTSQQFFAGRWSATRGKWRVRYTENELCVMTAGKVIIESTSGERMSFAAGDAFVIPSGFTGTWEVTEDCTKIYAIFEARS